MVIKFNFAILFIALLAINTAATGQTCKVVAITDGDTVKVHCDGQDMQIIRLSEIDSPEKKQAFGQKSKEALSDICYLKPVIVKPLTVDRYGRTVARLNCAGVDANAAMVKAGMAWTYTKYQTDTAFTQFELDARTARRGLWVDLGSKSPPVAPWIWRKLPKDER